MRAGARELAAWWLLGAAAQVCVAVPVELGLLATEDVPARQVIGAVVAAAALGALAAAPAVVGVVWVARRIDRAGIPVRRLWAMPVGLSAAAAAWLIADPLDRRLPALYLTLVGVVAAAVVASAYLARARRSCAVVVAAACLVTAGAVAADVLLASGLYPELHGIC